MKNKKDEYTGIYLDVNNVVIKNNDIVKVVSVNEECFFNNFKVGKFYKIGCVQDDAEWLGIIHNRGTIKPLELIKHIDLEVQTKRDIKK
jgi:hypothetical protein